MSLIEVSHVSKEYDVAVPHPGVKNVLKNIFCPDKKKVRAVTDISFTVETGELVGFIGENGAGKSSTIKMMSGILFPTSGSITVAGLCPYRERRKMRQILVWYLGRGRD